MRVALVWNARPRLVDITTRFEPYVEGLRAVGADAVTVCPAGTEVGYPYPTRTFADERELADPAFWTALGCEAVAVITWHRMTDILRAAKAAGKRVLAVAESDGLVSARHHPRAAFDFMVRQQPNVRGQLAAAKYWLERATWRAAAEHRALVENAAAADVTTFAGEGAVRVFRELLGRLGAGHLTDRVAWLPYPVPAAFCEGPVPTVRADRVLAVGRWDSPQKNGPLLAAAAHRLAAVRSTEVLVVGRGSEAVARMAGVATVKATGPRSRDEVRELMLGSRALVVSSRWESGPIVAWEMLASGGTVVGTPIPNVVALVGRGESAHAARRAERREPPGWDARRTRGLTALGSPGAPFGHVSRSHTPAALAAAVAAELAAWDRGDRDPAAVAAHWRPLVSPAGVAERMLKLLAGAAG